MPGIHFICSLNEDTKERKTASESVLGTLCYNEEYYVQALLSEQDYNLSCVKYDNYPVTVFENDEFYVCLEGRIYEREQESLSNRLFLVAERLFSQKNAKEFLAAWLLETAGEFVVFMKHKPSGRLLIFNDIFSRLPIYYYQSDGLLIISRDYHFVSEQIDNKEFDKMAIAQRLLFGFCLGNRTSLKFVEHLAPSTLIMIDMQNSSLQKDVVHVFNFEIKKNKGKSVKQNARQLVPLYIEACKNQEVPGLPT